MGRQRRMATAEAERVARAEVGEDGEGRGVGGASGFGATPFRNASSAFRGLPASASTTPSHSFRQMCRTFPPPPAQTKAEPCIRHPLLPIPPDINTAKNTLSSPRLFVVLPPVA